MLAFFAANSLTSRIAQDLLARAANYYLTCALYRLIPRDKYLKYRRITKVRALAPDLLVRTPDEGEPSVGKRRDKSCYRDETGRVTR